MSTKCLTCGAKADGKKFEFKHKGFEFSVAPRDRISCENCRIKEIMSSFDQLSLKNPKFIQLSKNGKIKVDWKFFLKLFKMKNKFYDEDVAMLGILTYLGIMTDIMEKGAIMILGYNTILNPHKWLFMRMEDAKEYAKLEFGNAQYDWYLVEINQLVKGCQIT